MDYMVVQQICCTQDTQWAKRMAHCEDAQHTAVAKAAIAAECIGNYCPTWLASENTSYSDNLDGVVRMTYSERPFVPNSETIQFIGNDDMYISDHNGINMTVDATRHRHTQIMFNVITHNLEGLCYRLEANKKDRYEYVMNNLTDYFAPHVKTGTIMLLQEAALQLDKKNLDTQTKILRTNVHNILTKLFPLNPNLTTIYDNYTGAILYDASVWNLVHELKIARKGSNKYSNAYLMQFIKYPEFQLWCINIHLKAMGVSMSTQSTINQTHIEELANIIGYVYRNNPEHYPVYFCGDFNNGSIKETLITNALQKVYRGDIYNEDSIDDIDQWQLIESAQEPEHTPLTSQQLQQLRQAMEV